MKDSKEKKEISWLLLTAELAKGGIIIFFFLRYSSTPSGVNWIGGSVIWRTSWSTSRAGTPFSTHSTFSFFFSIWVEASQWDGQSITSTERENN